MKKLVNALCNWLFVLISIATVVICYMYEHQLATAGSSKLQFMFVIYGLAALFAISLLRYILLMICYCKEKHNYKTLNKYDTVTEKETINGEEVPIEDPSLIIVENEKAKHSYEYNLYKEKAPIADAYRKAAGK